MRSENEAISKYTAAEILRNKRPWDPSRCTKQRKRQTQLSTPGPDCKFSHYVESTGAEDPTRHHSAESVSLHDAHYWIKLLPYSLCVVFFTNLCCHLVTGGDLLACFAAQLQRCGKPTFVFFSVKCCLLRTSVRL